MLLNKAPNKLFVYEYEFEIITNARHWLNISYNFDNNGFNIDALLKTVKNIDIITETDNIERKKIIDRLVDKLIWFLGCGKEIKNKDPISNKKLYDFKIDDDVIFSAFYRTYKINIEKEIDKMHWWWFMSLFRDLDQDCLFVNYYKRYRDYDTSSKDFQSLSPKTKEEIYKAIRDVSLENDYIEDDDNPFDNYRKKLLKKEL